MLRFMLITLLTFLYISVNIFSFFCVRLNAGGLWLLSHSCTAIGQGEQFLRCLWVFEAKQSNAGTNFASTFATYV